VVSVVFTGIQFILLIFSFSSLFIQSAFFTVLHFLFPHWLPVKLSFFHMWVVVDCCSFRYQISAELFCVFLEHFILDVLVFPFFISFILWAFACTFCFNSSINCAISIAFVTLYFWKIFLFFTVSLILS
jgi:hypothetical protein